MCGIAGFSSEKKVDKSVLESVVKTIRHRGPDSSGIFESPSSNVSFVHTRLSFFDLSEVGNQPMHFPELGLSITYNGEVYNFKSIKKELENLGYTFISTSDTEVILKAWHCWGEKSIDRLKGMFAFAIYDERKQKIFLIRDRFGIKPLYYTCQKNTFGFASELKAFVPYPFIDLELDWTSVCDFFVYRYVPSPKSIYKNVCKLPPAHYLTYDIQDNSIKTVEYWKLESDNKKDDRGELPELINEYLKQSVESHTRADVPVGMFLSGGYDSSAIGVYLKESNYNKAEAFSIGFEDWEKSEDQYAGIVAEHLNIPMNRAVLNETSLTELDKMPYVYDEPIADISIVPTYLVSQLARKKMKAVLSGEGADELFGGYWWQKEFYKLTHPKKLTDKLKLFWNAPDPVAFYANAASMGEFNDEQLKKMLHPDLHRFIPEDPLWFYRKHFKKKLSPLKQMQYMDIKCFMAELILVKVDRASMANSLEVRVPFLDHEMFEKVFSYDESEYFKPSVTKYLLHENIKGKLPNTILKREKQGFVGPDEYYMKKSFYKELFERSSLQKSGYVKQDYLKFCETQQYDWRRWKLAVMDKWFESWIV